MSDLHRFENLVRAARRETPPAVDVAASVLASVRAKVSRPAASVDRMAVLFAAASVLAASIVAMVAWQMVEEPMLAGVPNPFIVPIMAPR